MRLQFSGDFLCNTLKYISFPREKKNVEKMWEKNCCKTIDKMWLLIWLFYRKIIAEGHEQYFSHIFQNFLLSLKYHRPIIEPHFLTIKPFCHTFPTFFIDNFSNVKWRKIIILIIFQSLYDAFAFTVFSNKIWPIFTFK